MGVDDVDVLVFTAGELCVGHAFHPPNCNIRHSLSATQPLPFLPSRHSQLPFLLSLSAFFSSLPASFSFLTWRILQHNFFYYYYHAQDVSLVIKTEFNAITKGSNP